jgi:hypothetical protein
MDSDAEVAYRVGQIKRLKDAGIRSVCRVVTCQYGTSAWARACREKQDFLLSLMPVIDNPLRARKSNPRVLAGDIVLAREDRSVGGGKYVSLNSSAAYLGTCRDCPDQCGADSSALSNIEKEITHEGNTCRALPFQD